MRLLLLTTIILTMLAQPVWAQTVYYCVMTNLIDVNADGIKSWKAERFKMSVDFKNITFGSDGTMNGMILDTVNLYGDSSFVAKSKGLIALARFEPPNFFYSSVFSDEITSFHATCDKF